MPGSAVVLVGLMSFTAAVEGAVSNAELLASFDKFLDVNAPCPRGSEPPDYKYRCTPKPPLTPTYCCSLGEWLLNDGLLPFCLTIIAFVLVVGVILPIFLYEWCSWGPGNRHRRLLVQPRIYQDPAGGHIYFNGNHETRPDGPPKYFP